MELLEKEECQIKIKEITASHRLFGETIKPLSVVKDVRQTGTVVAIELKSESSGYTSSLSHSLYDDFLAEGVILRPLGNVIYILPPYCITEQELNKVYEVIENKLTGLSTP